MTTGNDQQQQVTTSLPSPQAAQLMDLALPNVTKYAATTPTRYAGSTISPFDPSQVEGQEGALDSAGTQTALSRAGAGTTANWLSPGALDVYNNPAVRGTIEAATRPITQQLTETTLPAIRSSAETTGNTGSSREGIAEGIASRGASTAIGDATSKIASDAYNTNVKMQLQALGLLPQTVGTQTTGDLTTSGVGDVRQAQAQSLLGENVSNFNFDQLAPYLQSKDIYSLAAGIPGGTTIGTANNPPRNTLTQSLGGAASGAALGAMTPIPGGAVVGGGIGALLPFLTR